MFMDASSRVSSALNAEGKWTFHASGLYIKALMVLFEMTQEKRLLSWARQLADMEIAHLERVTSRQWWRLSERSAFLEALLRLHMALVRGR